MILIRPAAERGVTNLGWLDSRHTFSFGDYYDPGHMGFRALRVINDDRVEPAQGFGTHPHRDMEILTYILEGSLEHKDSMGTGSIIHAGDVQRMSAGTGVLHSEFNPSREASCRFLQIWLLPERRGLAPSYEQRSFAPEAKRGRPRLVASRDGRDGSITIHQDVDVHAALLDTGAGARIDVRPGRHAWVQVARGSLRLNGRPLGEGDGAAVSDEPALALEGVGEAELLVFDLA